MRVHINKGVGNFEVDCMKLKNYKKKKKIYIIKFENGHLNITGNVWIKKKLFYPN